MNAVALATLTAKAVTAATHAANAAVTQVRLAKRRRETREGERERARVHFCKNRRRQIIKLCIILQLEIVV